jgi:hypothetical protein
MEEECKRKESAGVGEGEEKGKVSWEGKEERKGEGKWKKGGVGGGEG